MIRDYMIHKIITSCKNCIHYIPPTINKQTLDKGYGLCRLFRPPIVNPEPGFLKYEYSIIARTKSTLCGGKYYYSPPFTKK